MGRYITGDIERKLMFGVQQTDAADRFGVIGQEPEYLEYFFYEEDLPKVQKELDKIRKNLGDDIKLIDDFFKKHTLFNDNIMKNFHPDLPKIWKEYQADYADLKLGEDIEACIQRTGSCEFTAEF